MPLSEWPDKFQDGGGTVAPRMVEVVFPDSMLVAAKTPLSIGLVDQEGDNVELWIPIKQIGGREPNRGEWIGSIQVPKWLADNESLEYD